jgi:adenosine/AMP kinase
VIEAGHAFVFTLSEGFPVNVLKPPAVCLICARPPRIVLGRGESSHQARVIYPERTMLTVAATALAAT